MGYQFEQKQFTDLSQIECKILITRSQQVSYADIMVVKFIGEYGLGSAGNPDAQYMVAVLRAAVAAWEPQACIVDLSELKYEWGDTMDAVIGFADDILQVQPVSVVGPLCSEAIGTLIHGINVPPTAFTPDDFVYDNIDNALAQIEHLLAEASRKL